MDTGHFLGGIIGIAGAVVVADIMIGGLQRIPGQIVGESRTHYHVKVHQDCRIPGKKRASRKGDVVKVKKKLVRPRRTIL
jgi:hypothetical protein